MPPTVSSRKYLALPVLHADALPRQRKKAPSTVYLDLFAGQATNISWDTGRPIEGSLLVGPVRAPGLAS